MSYKKFERKQEEIFSEIRERGDAIRRGEKINEKQGLVSKLPEPGTEEQAYIIYLGYTSCARMTQFCDRLEETLTTGEEIRDKGKHKVMRYGPKEKNIHSTLALFNKRIVDIKKEDLISTTSRESTEDQTSTEIPYRGELEFNKDIIYKLKSSIDSTVFGGKKLKKPWMTHMEDFVHDQGTVITMPHGKDFSEPFYELRQEILEQNSKRGIELKPGWGSHITVARFRKEIPYKEMKEFNRLMGHKGSSVNWSGFSSSWDDVPAGIDYGVPPPNPETVNVGMYQFNRNGFFLKPLISISLDLLKI